MSGNKISKTMGAVLYNPYFNCEHPIRDTSIQFSKPVVLSTTASISILFILICVSFYAYAIWIQYLDTVIKFSSHLKMKCTLGQYLLLTDRTYLLITRITEF